MNLQNLISKGIIIALILNVLPYSGYSQEEDFTIEELMGKADIPLYGDGFQLRKEACDAFMAMKAAAYQDGIDLKIVSAYRSFDRQQAIFERKFINNTQEGMEPLEAIDKIIEYSTIPGTSRHHWGTEIDVIDGYPEVEGDVLVAEKFEEGGPFELMKQWMDEHAESFGFYLVYTDHPKRRGFKYEPWHYSYAPLSRPMLDTFRRKNILALLAEEDFEGAEHFTTGFLRSYIQDNILDINPDLL